jgi:D-aminopeptidase
VPVGRELGPDVVPAPGVPEGSGSIVVLVGTDAPLLPHQCRRLAQRASLGVGRTGGAGENSSGDFMLAFSTASCDSPVAFLANEELDPLFHATSDATERAIGNALLAAVTTTGRQGRVVHRLDPDLLADVMRRYGR